MQRDMMEELQAKMSECFGYVGVIDSGFDDMESVELLEAGDEDEDF